MSYASAKHIDVGAIPIIDIEPLRKNYNANETAKQILDAVENVGFFYIVNHGIGNKLIENARTAARRFFSYTLEQKNQIAMNKHHRGFLAIGQSKMYGDAKADLKESFIWGLKIEDDDPRLNSNSFLVPNRWPDFDSAFKAQVYPYLEACNACGKDLFKAFAIAMDIPKNSFNHSFDAPISRASLVYYPPQPPILGADQFGVAPHTDFGCLTLLCQDDVGGLQVQHINGDWVTAHPIDNTLVANVGDLLQRWTNDRFRSTPHRVVNTSGKERYSLVAAVDPDFETLIDPSIVCKDSERPKYESIACGDYILDRFDKSFKYRK